MDLSSLDSTLPPALADAERDMGDKFRGMLFTSWGLVVKGMCLEESLAGKDMYAGSRPELDSLTVNMVPRRLRWC
jgi:hypothetical protein